MSEYKAGYLELDLTDGISQCNANIESSINESELLSKLTDEQKTEISNIVFMELLAKFDNFKLKMYAERGE